MLERSPFPGIDPWLEEHWGDVHHSLVVNASDLLSQRLPRGLVARLQVREFVEPWEDQRGFHPATVADDPVRQGSICILEIGSNRTVAWIEFLKYGNKVWCDGQVQFLRMREALMADRVHFVQVDLLRSGEAMPVAGGVVQERDCRPYSVSICRVHSQPEVQAIRLRDRLPAIRIPLRATDDDVLLDLQGLVNIAYRGGRYDETDYTVGPHPPLEGEDAKWADQLLRGKGLRK